jgi:hypothetical protein
MSLGDSLSIRKNNTFHLIREFVTSTTITTKFNSKWISDNVLTELLNASKVIPDTIERRNVNRLMIKAFTSDIGKKNNGLIITSRNHRVQKMGRIVHGYYIKKKINEQDDDCNWWERLYVDYTFLMNDCNVKTRAATSDSILNRLRSSSSCITTNNQEPTNQASSSSASLGLRSRTIITPDKKTAKKLKTTPDSTVDNPPSHKHHLHQIWKEKTSINQFIGKNIQLHQNRSVIDAIDYQINLLRSGWQDGKEGWRQVIDDGDIDNCMSHYDIFKVRRKCEYILHALLIARIDGGCN